MAIFAGPLPAAVLMADARLFGMINNGALFEDARITEVGFGSRCSSFFGEHRKNVRRLATILKWKRGLKHSAANVNYILRERV